ncbi:biotin transporter BioY [Desulfofundulus thermobenzoicus]|uniref:Biotin transporter n=1 Tax=Desulfofundulus thermobenzoicus TaxID=29376 RepID=A0A6N7INK7_9FIRM|nr:biotin transporter BioY [Desulfofundulus thermobenzoicus]MQL51189.1 biotin transporter BioY [Desulfofundulus thermobenzoicus]
MQLSVRDMVLVSMFAALTAVGAFIKIPIPYVPFTLQFLFVLFAGLLLGRRLAFMSQVVYLVLGLAGLPIFTQGGGPAYVLQPTFGYLVGFALGAYVIGAVAEKLRERGVPGYFLASLAGLVVVYTLGVLHLYIILNYVVHKTFTLAQAVWFGAIICSPGDLFLSVVASLTGSKVYKTLQLLNPVHREVV